MTVNPVQMLAEYQSDGRVRKMCKLLFALPFLPPSDIHVAFDRIVNKVSGLDSDKLFALCRYVKETWIDSKVWPPKRWCVYQRPIRTNNDCEGWHFRMNAKARKNSLPLYVMIRLLHREWTTVTWQMRMLSEGKVLRRRKARQQCMEAALLWTEFAAGKRSAYKLLRACRHLCPNSAYWLTSLLCLLYIIYVCMLKHEGKIFNRNILHPTTVFFC